MFNSIKKRKTFIRKKLLVVSYVCLLFLSACGTDKEIEKEAERIVEAIENKDMETVEEIILGDRDFTADEELAGFFKDSESGNNGIIAKIIEQDSMEVKKITGEYIVYELSAPELSGIFNDVMKEENLTTDSFDEYIYDYIATADRTKIQVEVSYTYENEVFTADYSTQEFINGITGNMITAYQELIQQMIQENSGESVQ